jgi:hypothetical protein
MRAGANNFLMRGSRFDVLKNDFGGVTDSGVNFQLRTPVRGGTSSSTLLTPSRVLLTHGETRMNMLTPENSSVIHHANIEVR